jgi:hypothetical protein
MMKIMRFALVFSAVLLVGVCWAQNPQIYDPDYRPTVANPAYAAGQGPLVLVDEAHNNYHTIAGRYHVFAELLTNDGYRVEANTVPFTAASLANAKVLVIANALNAQNVTTDENWKTPILSALTGAEIQAVVQWVKAGGSLLLIADHMPFPGAIADLAARFGVIWQNAFAFAGNHTFQPGDPNILRFGLGTPGPSGGIGYDHPIFAGRNASEAVQYVSTFTGSAFRTLPSAQVHPLLELGTGPSSLVLYPTASQVMSLQTPMALATGLLQGATVKYGEGRVAFMGEAAMFAARIADFISPGYKMGMNNDQDAPYNKQFTLNLLHWLSGLLPLDKAPSTRGLVVSEAPVGGMQRQAGKVVPETYALYQNSPNPFNPSTEIRYAVPEAASVRIEVFNSLGQRVRTLVRGEHGPGEYSVIWDGKDTDGQPVTAGVYLYQMKTGEFSGSGKMILVP